jgi:hypothetical protein
MLMLPLIFLVASTRIALGVGLGLLLVGKMSRDARRGTGWGLLAVGALSTIPLNMEVLGKRQITRSA